ncbi:tetratricopeptide repeat protein [Fodinicola acaciae]|uniref:tetratricopeptide repeat protein n=1 Tax=Fodinicola acaciae TaxID=2681555 RepID=UPI0013D80465|nr:tetratricopeptide repeat protein [Fodinicola acaciae]
MLDRAQALADLGRHTEATTMLGDFLAVEPDHVPALCLLAYCHGENDDVPAMLDAASRACAADPQDEWAVRLRAVALTRSERPEEAIAAARAAARLAPESWASYTVLAVALFGLPWRRPAALAAARQAVRLAPYEPDTHVTRGVLQQALGMNHAARRNYRRALALDPQNVTAAVNLGRIAENTGRLSDAARIYTAAAATSPGTVDGATHVRRVLVQLASRAWLVGACTMFLLLFTVFPVMWVVAAAVVAGNAYWSYRTVRAFPPAIRPVAISWMRTDPPFLARAICTAIVLVTGIGVGIAAPLVPPGPAILPLLLAILIALPATAIAIAVVDRRRPDNVVFDLESPAATGGWGKFVLFRLFRLSCLFGFVLWFAAIAVDDWAVRAVLGALALVGFGFYYRWIMRRPARPVGLLWNRFPMPVPFVALAVLANLLFAVSMIVLPEPARPLLENLAVAPFVLVLFAIPAQIAWLLVRLVARIRR